MVLATDHPPTYRFQKSIAGFWRLASGSASSSFSSSISLPTYAGHWIVYKLHTLVFFIVTRSGILVSALAKLFSLRGSSQVPETRQRTTSCSVGKSWTAEPPSGQRSCRSRTQSNPRIAGRARKTPALRRARPRPSLCNPPQPVVRFDKTAVSLFNFERNALRTGNE